MKRNSSNQDYIRLQSSKTQVNGRPAITMIPSSEIEPTSVKWYWKGYIPRGKLIILEGDPGSRKSFVTVDIASRISTGRIFPGDDTPRVPENALIFNAEDDLSDTITPRIVSAGGDRKRIFLYNCNELGHSFFLPEGIGHLRETCIKYEANVVVIDPISSFAPKGLTNESKARKVLDSLASIASELNVTIIAVRHLVKSTSIKNAYRGTGSIAVSAAARIVLRVEPSPKYDDVSIVKVTKGNIGPQYDCISFCLNATSSEIPHIDWDEGSIGDDDIYNSNKKIKGSSAAEAESFLLEQLSNGPLPCREIDQRSSEAGIATSTLRRAKTSLNIISNKDAFNSGWVWSLPLKHSSSSSEPDMQGGISSYVSMDATTVVSPDSELKTIDEAIPVQSNDHLRHVPRRRYCKSVWRSARLSSSSKVIIFGRRHRSLQGDHLG